MACAGGEGNEGCVKGVFGVSEVKRGGEMFCGFVSGGCI